MRIDRPRKTKVKSHLLCRSCGGDWEYHGTKNQTICPFCGKSKDARDRAEDTKRYAEKAAKRKQSLVDWYSGAANRRERSRRSRSLLRKRVFFKIGGSIHPQCVRCGCNDARLLEINHKNGGGRRLKEGGKGSASFYFAIAQGKRSVEDLELLCRPCNAIHYLETKYGPLPIKVVWGANHDEPADGSHS